MSIQELMDLLSQNRVFVLIYLAFIPLSALFLRLLHGKYRGRRPPWKYFYSVIIYLACVPGVFSLVITLYSIMFLQANLLILDIYVYYLPVLSMILTLTIIQRSVVFNQIPGWEKIYGLITLFALTFIILIILERLRVFVYFGGSVFLLFAAAVIIFLLLKHSIRLLLGIRKR